MGKDKRWTIFVCPAHPEFANSSWKCRVSTCRRECVPVVVVEARDE